MAILRGIARRGAKRAPMHSLESVKVTKTGGLEGDFRGRPGKRQVSVLSRESWQEACTEIGMELSWLTRRANLLVEGITFMPEMVGRKLRIGTLLMEICQETDPCSRMDEAAEGLLVSLMPDWRGGVLCRVLAGGEIRCGDAVELLP